MAEVQHAKDLAFKKGAEDEETAAKHGLMTSGDAETLANKEQGSLRWLYSSVDMLTHRDNLGSHSWSVSIIFILRTLSPSLLCWIHQTESLVLR